METLHVGCGHGPITVHTTGARRGAPAVTFVHGSYGVTELVELHPRGRETAELAHLALTWSERTSSGFQFVFTLLDGAQVSWVVPRSLLRDGGGDGEIDHRVTHRGSTTVIESADQPRRVEISRGWLGQLIQVTEQIVVVGSDADLGICGI